MIRFDGLLRWAASLNNPSEATANLPTCPYARRAFDDGRVSIVVKMRFDGEADVRNLIDGWSERFDVVLLVIDRSSISADAAHALADKLSDEASRLDIVVMVDHPDRPFVVAGHNNSNGDHVIFFIQRQSRLSKASAALRTTGYYRNWPKQGSV